MNVISDVAWLDSMQTGIAVEQLDTATYIKNQFQLFMHYVKLC